MTAPAIALAFVLALNLLSLLASATQFPFWFDELLTFYLSRMSTFEQVLSALRDKADGMTPTWYALQYCSAKIPGPPEITLRLSSMIGHALAIVGTYLFLKRPFSIQVAVTMAGLVAISPLRDYAMEARPYALLTGSVAIAAAFWRDIGRSRLAALIFPVFLALAVSCHHLAPLTIACFVLAEAAHWLQIRKLRRNFWIGLPLSFIPLAFNLPLLLSYSQSFSQSFWSKAEAATLISSFMLYLGFESIWSITVVFVVFAVSLRMLFDRKVLCRSWDSQQEGLTLPELVLALLLTSYPIILCTVATIKGSGYVARYGWPAAIGLAILFAAPLQQILGTAWRIVLVPVLFFSLVPPTHSERFTGLRAGGPVIRDTHIYARLDSFGQYKTLPIVVANSLQFFVEYRYLPKEWSDRVRFLTNPRVSIDIVGTDTADLTLQALARHVAIPVEQESAFLSNNEQFLVHADRENFDWLMPHLLAGRRHKIVLLISDRKDEIYLLQREE